MPQTEANPHRKLSQTSLDSRFVAYTSSPNSLVIKNLTQSEGQSQVLVIDVAFKINNISISPCSRLVLAWSSTASKVSAYNLRGKPVWTRNMGNDNIKDCVWTPDSKQVVIRTMTFLHVNYIEDGIECRICYVKNKSNSLAFSSSGQFAAVCEKKQRQDRLSIYCVSNWKLLVQFSLKDMTDLSGVRWTPQSDSLVAWDSYLYYRVVAIDLSLEYSIKIGKDTQLGVMEVAFSTEGKLLAVESFDQRIIVYSTDTWLQCGQLEYPSSLNDISQSVHCYLEKICIDPTTSRPSVDLVSFRRNPSTQFVIPRQKQNSKVNHQLKQCIPTLSFSHSGNFLAGFNQKMPRVLWIWDMKTYTIQTLIILKTPVTSFGWSPEKQQLCICYGTPNFIIWSPIEISMTDISTTQEATSSAIKLQSVKWCKDGKKTVLSDRSEGYILFWKDQSCSQIVGF